MTTIIDPNAVIGHDFQAVIVATTKGQIITGLVKHEDQKTLTIQTATEKTATEAAKIPKQEIEERSVSKSSFMPEGILQKLSDEQVRDLIAYLQGPEQVPLSPEKTDKNPKKSEPSTMLIEPGELQKKLKQPGLRILDTRPQPEYVQGHIPGAVWVNVKGCQDLGKKERGFHDAKACDHGDEHRDRAAHCKSNEAHETPRSATTRRTRATCANQPVRPSRRPMAGSP